MEPNETRRDKREHGWNGLEVEFLGRLHPRQIIMLFYALLLYTTNMHSSTTIIRLWPSFSTHTLAESRGQSWAWEGASTRRLREMPLCAAFDITFHSLFP